MDNSHEKIIHISWIWTISYPHPHLNSPSQYTPKACRKTAKIAEKDFIIICKKIECIDQNNNNESQVGLLEARDWVGKKMG